MNLNSNDIAVIEQALREAMNNGYDYQSVLAYREVLSKLQAMPIGHDPGATTEQASKDGFRYDYDDASDINLR